MKDEARAFAVAAKAYCAWAEAEPLPERDDALRALRLLADLYSKALALPDADVGENIDAEPVTIDAWRAVAMRFGSLPFQYYTKVFTPVDLDDDAPVTADLADDLADIYRDIKPALSLYESGHLTEAVWTWRFSFLSHWGRHATGAMQALHTYLVDSEVDL